MKKAVTIFCICLLSVINLVAQKDSTAQRQDSLTIQQNKAFHKAVILKINPGLMITAPVVGEFGGMVQINVSDNIALFAGAGYNLTVPVYNPKTNPPGYSLNPSGGYTIRWGGYYFFSKHRFISFHFFYRKWDNTMVFCYFGGNTHTTQYSTTTDYVTNDFLDGQSISSDEAAVTPYTVNNTNAAITDITLLYGRQIIGKYGHFFFEWYLGIGIRFKTIYNEELGNFEQTGAQYYPDKNPFYSTYQSTYPEMKLGFQVGYKL